MSSTSKKKKQAKFLWLYYIIDDTIKKMINTYIKPKKNHLKRRYFFKDHFMPTSVDATSISRSEFTTLE
jgi:hypothetical protein